MRLTCLSGSRSKAETVAVSTQKAIINILAFTYHYLHYQALSPFLPD
jgi:hypothetical protein